MTLFQVKTQEPIQDWSAWKPIGRYFSNYKVEVCASEADTFIYLEIIEVKEKFRRMGIGKKSLEQLIYYAKRKNKCIILEANQNLGTPKEELISFYKKVGFEAGKLSVPYRHNMYYLPEGCVYSRENKEVPGKRRVILNWFFG